MNEANVLGQRTRRVNIDYGLADRLNAEVAKEIRRQKLAPKPEEVDEQIVEPVTLESEIEYDWDSLQLIKPKKRDSQEGWANYWIQKKPKLLMASISDLYAFGKKCRTGVSNVYPRATNKIILKLEDDFRKNLVQGIITSTQIDYDQSLTATEGGFIDQHYFLPDKNPLRVIGRASIPYFAGPIELMLKTPKGLDYMRQLLDTIDSSDDIIRNLVMLSGNFSQKIFIETSSEIERVKSKSAIAIYVSGQTGFFHLTCGNVSRAEGLAYGIIAHKRGDKK
ncbi:hypothetical protein JXB28_06495 [Candidatus Woesearchaeota archaeon]|nr:hypothetical protein [Candidatus Woesearchaeota archaeon]